MQAAVTIRKTKVEFFKQKDAFYLFKLVGVEKAAALYPEYKNFMLTNSERSFDEIEEMLNLKIRQACINTSFNNE